MSLLVAVGAAVLLEPLVHPALHLFLPVSIPLLDLAIELFVTAFD